MIRVFFIYVLPLIAPTVVYLLWRLWHLKRGAGEGTMATAARRAPWPKLIVAGVALLIATLAVAALSGGEPAHETYVPPHMENGRVVPGQARPDGMPGRAQPDGAPGQARPDGPP